MSGLLLMVITAVFLVGGYLLYGRYLAKTWGIDPKAKTPAYAKRDGVDYEPADTAVVFGHQFASIAGAGPINGPIMGMVFGWVPVFLWLLIGGLFFGAVQDFSAMYASVKNKGRSIGYVIEEYIGIFGKKLFLFFVWMFCILVVAAFTDIVAGTFNGFTPTGETIEENASVASTSMLFIFEAVALGFVFRYAKLKKWINTLLTLFLLVSAVCLGLSYPVFSSTASWHIIIFVYILIASVTPVWALLQPRDYLNSYLLLVMIFVSFIGVIVTNPTISMPAFTGFYVEGAGNLFPIMFVTVTCGAVSGFHGLIASTTASKQIKNETNILPVSFGAMLLETFLAVIALIAAASFAVGEAGSLGYTTPPQIFAGGIANFLSQIGLSHTLTFTLMNLAISAFALTSLDSVARVGRLSLQELFLDASIDDDNMETWRKIVTNKYLATFVTLALAYLLAKVGYQNVWPLFGSANQLFSALSLMVCAVYLKRTNRKGWMLWVPMIVMMCVTMIALCQKMMQLLAVPSFANLFQFAFAVALFILGIIIATLGLRKLTEQKDVCA